MNNNVQEKKVPFSKFDIAQCMEFKEVKGIVDITPIQARLYYLMLHSDTNRRPNESLYGWCARVNLSKSTVYGIFTKNNKNMHSSVAKTIAEATGASHNWVQKGIGVPFVVNEVMANRSDLLPIHNIICDYQLNLDVLKICLEATEGALNSTFNKMEIFSKARFIFKFYRALLEETGQEVKFDFQTCILAIFTIEVSLNKAKQHISSRHKSTLISDIYTNYITNQDMKRAAYNELLNYSGMKELNDEFVN